MNYLELLETVEYSTVFRPAPNCLRFVVVNLDQDRTAVAEATPDVEFLTVTQVQVLQSVVLAAEELLSWLAEDQEVESPASTKETLAEISSLETRILGSSVLFVAQELLPVEPMSLRGTVLILLERLRMGQATETGVACLWLLPTRLVLGHFQSIPLDLEYFVWLLMK